MCFCARVDSVLHKLPKQKKNRISERQCELFTGECYKRGLLSEACLEWGSGQGRTRGGGNAGDQETRRVSRGEVQTEDNLLFFFFSYPAFFFHLFLLVGG